MTEITLQSISKNFGKTRIIHEFSHKITSGSFLFLVGPSGCGKSTLLRIIAGLETATNGQVFFDSQDVTRQPPQERHCGFVFQNYCLWPHLTVKENILFGPTTQKWRSNRKATALHEILELVHLEDLEARYPHELSGGQQQRVALARSLIVQPRVLLLDEPFSNLDTALRIHIRSELKSIHMKTGMTIVAVSHDSVDAEHLATEVVTMTSVVQPEIRA